MSIRIPILISKLRNNLGIVIYFCWFRLFDSCRNSNFYLWIHNLSPNSSNNPEILSLILKFCYLFGNSDYCLYNPKFISKFRHLSRKHELSFEISNFYLCRRSEFVNFFLEVSDFFLYWCDFWIPMTTSTCPGQYYAENIRDVKAVEIF